MRHGLQPLGARRQCHRPRLVGQGVTDPPFQTSVETTGRLLPAESPALAASAANCELRTANGGSFIPTGRQQSLKKAKLTAQAAVVNLQRPNPVGHLFLYPFSVISRRPDLLAADSSFSVLAGSQDTSSRNARSAFPPPLPRPAMPLPALRARNTNFSPGAGSQTGMNKAARFAPRRLLAEPGKPRLLQMARELTLAELLATTR